MAQQQNMEIKKILIVSAAFYPQNSPRAFRTTELALELARQGHRVVVYIPKIGYDYQDYSKENNIDIRSLGEISFKEIKLKGKGVALLIRRLFRRSMGMLFEYPQIELMFKVFHSLKNEKGYDLLISIAVPYPIHWGVALIKPQKKGIAKTWVADCGDPYMGHTTDTFKKVFYFKYIEKWFCRMADYITIPFEGARSGYYPEFQDKIRIIPQGFRLDDMKLPKYKKNGDCPTFAYAGGFIPGKRDPRAMLDFLVKCQKDFRFIVYTSSVGVLQPYKDKLKGKLIIREYIDRSELLKVLSQLDFLVNFDNNTKSQLPSKLIDYAIIGRPVFNVTQDTDFNVLEKFLEGNYAKQLKLEPANNYDIKLVAKKFLTLSE
jgi:hypothetical protein